LKISIFKIYLLTSTLTVLPFTDLFNQSIGFGPTQGIVWEGYDGKLYQPYNKRDKLGKPFDFVSAAALNLPTKAPKAAVAKENELFDEEDKGFEVVEEDFKKKVKPVVMKKPMQRQQQQRYYQDNR
jgi:hypothetical protein